jgi:hypothetical protein
MTMHAKNDSVELDGDENDDGSLSLAQKARYKKKTGEEEQGFDSRNVRSVTGKEGASVSGYSVAKEAEEMLSAEEQDSSREEPAGHEDVTGLREGHTPPAPKCWYKVHPG